MLSKRERALEAVGIDAPEVPKKVPKNEVSLDQAFDESWLVKIAPSVWKAWDGMEKGADVGELIVKTVKRRFPNGNIVEEESMVVKMGGLETKFQVGPRVRLPDYTLSGRRDIDDMHTFTRPPTGTTGPVAMTSTIKRQYMMQPQIGKGYNTLVRRRLVSNTIKEGGTRPVSMAEVNQATQHNMKSKGTAFDQAFHSAQKAKLEARGEAAKGLRERLDPAILRSRLFEMYSQKDHYMVKDLNRLLQQPERHLREVLGQIARMHTTGPLRNHFELKPEFKGGAIGEGAGT